MCGIVGYIGNNKASEIVVSGLKRLEYRGYDSAGITTLEGTKLLTTKCKGKVHYLSSSIIENNHIGTVGMGHTRWATHGKPSKNNAHPHFNQDKNISIVHNGIIENYFSIKEYLKSKGLNFKSETDTEVLSQLIGYIYKEQDLDFSESVRVALSEVVGAYGIVGMCHDEPDKIIAARLGSPLIIGIGDNEYFVASDSSPIIDYTRNIIILDDGEMAVITKEGYEIRKIKNNDLVNKEIEKIEHSIEEIEKGDYAHFMLKEIYEQPVSLLDSVRGRINFENQTLHLGGLNDWIQHIKDADIIYITACGTSWHSALIGSYMLEEVLNIPVKVEYASELRYREVPVNSKTAVIAISQSGETADTLAAIKKCKSLGAITIGVVNVVGSSISRETDCGVYIHAGPEIGVASTKAFTSQVAVLALITLFLKCKFSNSYKEQNEVIESFSKLSKNVDMILDQADKIKDIANRYFNSSNFLYLGRGYHFPVALEGALKLKEISYIHAEGYPAAEMKHGPIALIDDKMPVVFIVTKSGYEKIVSNIREVKSRGGKIIIITSQNKEELKDYSNDIIYIPETHKFLSPIISSVPLQLLAYYVAVFKGCDVDQPRNLAKSVTVE
ncbi:MAG: glutamine--fructose-6-phosphate transaminase (isomerizing) [Candidatus Marinimicrobia bacterium]|nr:glutamine--fructose-6-phosphate transaminase (isomerizing) [Candidatus Neomarinimicrobiota bacterium]